MKPTAPSRSYETLVVEEPAPHVLQVRLDRPQVLNALNTRMAEELGEVFMAPPASDLRALIVTGTGERAFCAGADLKERLGIKDDAAWAEHHEVLERCFAAMRAFAVPVIAAVNGVALGGGCELTLACDLVLAADSASFSQPEVRRGIIPGCGATRALPQRIGITRAKEMILTGRTVRAEEALEWGLVNRVVPAAELPAAARELAREIARNGPVAVREAKRVIDRGIELGQEDGIALELEAYRRTVATEDRHEGVAAFNEKRQPSFRNR